MSSIEKIFCINLKDNIARWNNVDSINKRIKDIYGDTLYIERFEAVDSRQNGVDVLKTNNLKLQPINISTGMYFYYSPGALGCFLSHYNVWKKIVEDRISYTLIIEDDIATDTLFNFLKNKTIVSEKIENTEFLFLSKRVFYNKPYIDFWGAESYVLSYKGAQKLLKSIENPSVFDRINDFEEAANVIKYFNSKKIELPKQNKTISANSIIVPNDRLFSLCCHKNCSTETYLKHSIYSCVQLKNTLSNNSNIIKDIKSWGAKPSEIEKYLKTL